MLLDVRLVGIALGSAFAAALFALAVMRAFRIGDGQNRSSVFGTDPAEAYFLFDHELLIDCTPRARALLAASPIRGGDWARLIAFLLPRFPEIVAQLQDLPSSGELSLISELADTPLHLTASFVGGLCKITLTSDSPGVRSTHQEPIVQKAIAEELLALRKIAAAAPGLIWQESPNGDVVWANAAYIHAWEAISPEKQVLTWPLPHLLGACDGATCRRNLVLPDGEARWYDVETRHVDKVTIRFASPADAVIRAETTLQTFMQTLTKTFAQLPIGLAIFDKDRKLQLFNPALANLSGLAVDFLASRPSMLSVLDALRERRMLPEPKNYHSWRRQLLDMEKAAASGQYEETWNLTDGQIYRVIGRPHPNGALALMLEDISTEMLRTRRFRADLELGQSVVDEIDIALAVFSASGHLVMSNPAFMALWGIDATESLQASTIKEMTLHWRAQTAPSNLWTDVEDFVATVGDRAKWNEDVRLLDGRLVACQFSPLSAGATLATFQVLPAAEAGTPRIADQAALLSA